MTTVVFSQEIALKALELALQNPQDIRQSVFDKAKEYYDFLTGNFPQFQKETEENKD